MNTKKNSVTKLGRTLRIGLMAAAVTALIGGTATAPAFAADWGHRSDRERGENWRAHERFEHRHFVRVVPDDRYDHIVPRYGYAPAPFYPVPLLRFGFDFR
jgi:hypothetical protein